MASSLLLLVPIAGLALLALVGVGGAAGLAPRFPRDAQAALAPVVAAALLALASVVLPVGVPPLPVAATVAVLGAAASLALRRRAVVALRGAAWPLAVALAAIGLAGAPAVARGGWEVSSLYGSTDAYHWTSQARAYADGPAPPPVAEHPDRLTYERSRDQQWAVAVPFLVLVAATLTGSDPADIYAAAAAVLFVLLPLAAYAVARGLLGWAVRPSTAVGLALALNAALLFANHFSWQQQVAGAAFAFAAAAFLRLGLEPEGDTRELVLGAGLAAAALATYRLGFSPYVAGSLAVVAAAYLVARRSDPSARRTAIRAAGVFALVFAALGGPSLVALARGLPGFTSSGGFSTAFKEAFAAGQPAEALGLVPHVWAVEEGWPEAARLAWLAVATVATLALLALGARALRRAPLPRGDFVAAGAVLALAGWAVLRLPVFAPYLSFKLLSYAAPFLVLLALAPLARSRTPAPLVAVALAVPSAAVAIAAARGELRTPGPVTALPAEELPADAVVAIETDDPWEQAWAIYALRERRVSVERPSFLLTAQGLDRDPSSYRHRPITHRLGRGSAGDTVWRREELVLSRVP